MISRRHRFHGYGSLTFTYRHGKTVRSQWFALRFTRNPKRSHYRAAVVVSRKVHKSAVVRNRIRRRLYTLISDSLGDEVAAYDIVLTVFSDKVATAPIDELRHSLIELLKSADIQ